MTRQRALYSVLQYVPDSGRAEGANVGVAIYLPSTGQVAVRTSPTLKRVEDFFRPKKAELRRIELALQACKDRLESAQGEFASEPDFCQFVAARADAVRLTPPRRLVFENLAQTLDELYRDLVGDDERPTRRKSSQPAFPPLVAEIFGRLEVARKLWKPGPIRIPGSNHSLQVPVAYQNGRVNYVLPQSLAHGEKHEQQLQKLGFSGLLIHQRKINESEGQLVVLSSDENASLDIEQRFDEILDSFQVRFVPFAQAVDFALEVERTAH